uniref:hypothetical protein n=1 Tax=Candidatus Electrothrix sp. TaxID=2170559 RepID=UPI00405763A0
MPPAIDEFEDLTQFADESFDTDEVDLFEFTDDEESPLLRLKSIVLSLDWDITEDTLTELTEELSNLRSLWDGDKVAQIYLQGMDNIGKYLQKEGAYAHPNAIKLLLTLFYNYEKIIFSTDLSTAAVTSMLKADVRKFKVLQYQIGTIGNEGHAEKDLPEHSEEPVQEPRKKTAKADPSSDGIIQEGLESSPPALRGDTDDPLTSMEATILGLEWEVTQEGLKKFHAEATTLREHLNDNRDAQILVQGLQALGAYIREEESNAHPDSFTILHSFYDALKLLIKDTNLTAEQRKRVLLEQIGSLNSLKAIIAKSAAEKRADKAETHTKEDAKERETAKVAEATETVEAGGTEEPVSEEEQDADFDSPVANDDTELDLFSDDFNDEGDEFVFDGEDEISDNELKGEESFTDDFEFDTEEDGLDLDLDEGLDEDLFADEAPGDEQDFSLDDDGDQDESIVPALTDADEEEGFNEELVSAGIDDGKATEFDEKLDSFFDFGDEDVEQQEEDAVVEENAVVDEALEADDTDIDTDDAPGLSTETEESNDDEAGESDVELDSFFDFSDEIDADEAATEEDEKSRAESWKDEILAMGSEEADGEEEAFIEGEVDYDSFFNFDIDESEDDIFLDDQEADIEEEALESPLDDSQGKSLTANDEISEEINEGEELDIALDGSDDFEEAGEITAALADADEEGGFNESELSSDIDDEKAAELDEKLNFFFEFDEEEQKSSSEEKGSVTEDDIASPEVLAKSEAALEVPEEESEISLDEISEEGDEEESEVSFAEDDFDGDIAGFSLDDDEIETVNATDDSANIFADSEEEIEGLDAIFDLDEDKDNTSSELETSGEGIAEDIPALEDKFVVALDDEDADDVLTPPSNELDSFLDVEEEDNKESVEAESTEATEDIALDDEFFLSLDEDESEDDEFDFSFDNDAAEKTESPERTISEEMETVPVLEEGDDTVDSDPYEEVALSLDEEVLDDAELVDFPFENNEGTEDSVEDTGLILSFDDEENIASDEGAITESGDASESDAYDEIASSLDDDESTGEFPSFSVVNDEVSNDSEDIAEFNEASDEEIDSFFDLEDEEETELASVDGDSADASVSDDEFGLSLDDEEDEIARDEDLASASSDSEVDEFALPLDDEELSDTGESELSDFSFSDGDEDEPLAETTEVSDSSEEIDSFFDLEDEEETELASVDGDSADASASDDEFGLSLDDEEDEIARDEDLASASSDSEVD